MDNLNPDTANFLWILFSAAMFGLGLIWNRHA
jgi:hypothetical protein